MTGSAPPRPVIVPMQARHISAAATLMGQSDPWVTLGITRERALHSLMHHDIPGVVALLDDRVVGFVRYEPRGFINLGAYIRTVAVDPSVRGQRVGEALVTDVEARVFAEVGLLFLFCSSFNTRGQKFYERLGYQRVGEVPALVVPEHGEVLFVKRRSGGAP